MNSTDDSNKLRRTVCYLTSTVLPCLRFGIIFLSCMPVPALALQNSAADSNPQLLLAERELASGEFARAENTLRDLLQVNPSANAHVYEMLATAQLRLKSSEEALTTCETGLALFPSSNSLATLYVSLLRESLDASHQIARLDATTTRFSLSPPLLVLLGEDLLMLNKEDPRAFQLLASAVASSPHDPEAHFFYGESACFNQEDELCIRELRLAHELAPQNQQANLQLYTMIAVSEDKLNLSSQAGEDFNRAMAANRDISHPNPYAALKYAAFLSSQNKRDQAMAIVDEALTWDPAYGPAHFERAKDLAEHKNRQEAVVEAEAALKDPHDAETELRSYHAFLAKTYFAMGRQQDALVHQAWIEAHPQR
jgi:tetratricopeptide (TPR) repeat protein